jgi:hypothetical protein
MEDAELLKMSGFSVTGIAIGLVIYKVIKGVLNKKLVSNCCGRRMEVGVAISEQEAHTPRPTMPDTHITITNPLKPAGKTGK